MNAQVIFLGNNCKSPSQNQLEQSTMASSKPGICFPHLLIPVPEVTGTFPLLPLSILFLEHPSVRAQSPTDK